MKKIFENTATISVTRYNELIKQEERLEALVRYVEANNYVDRTDIASIVGAELKEGEK